VHEVIWNSVHRTLKTISSTVVDATTVHQQVTLSIKVIVYHKEVLAGAISKCRNIKVFRKLKCLNKSLLIRTSSNI